MPDKIRCDVRQIGIHSGNFTKQQGLTVTEGPNGLRYLDPQPEPRSHASAGPSADPTEWLALSRANPPELEETDSGLFVVRRLRLNRSILNKAFGDLGKLRAFSDRTDGQPDHVLLAIIKHATEGQIGAAAVRKLFPGAIPLRYHKAREHGPNINLLLLEPNGRVDFMRPNREGTSSDRFRVVNDIETGFSVKRVLDN